MKYLKSYEKVNPQHYLYPTVKVHIDEIYEYLYNLGLQPKIYKITSNLIKPKLLGFDIYYKIKTNYNYLIYFESNNKTPDYIINRSVGSWIQKNKILSEFEPDEEKEKEMKLILINKKYNL
jgi:hypothetical protein